MKKLSVTLVCGSDDLQHQPVTLSPVLTSSV